MPRKIDLFIKILSAKRNFQVEITDLSHYITKKSIRAIRKIENWESEDFIIYNSRIFRCHTFLNEIVREVINGK